MKRIFLPVLCVAAAFAAYAENPLNYSGELFGNAGDGKFAPYFMMANNGGVLTQAKTVGVRAKAWKEMDLSRRFTYSFGADVVAGHASSVGYLRYDAGKEGFVTDYRRPAAIWLQQLYAEVKFRGVYLSAGMKERKSPLLNPELGSGDFIESNNARPIPQVRAGFIDFQNIPFTNGWVQIQGELAYGKYTHNKWLEDHYNYYSTSVTTGVWMHYKRLYLRTKPSKPFSVTVGMQVAMQFGGDARSYSKGILTGESSYDTTLKEFWYAFTHQSHPDGDYSAGDTQYRFGNTVGAWDFVARYRLKEGSELKAYFQWPYEDGSGIGKLNGFDGIWGLEYQNKDKKGIVSGAVIEYVDFTNQSGPLHWAPNDHSGTEMKNEATGADSYYDNFRYNSFMNYGLSQGTPFIPSIIYNTDGYMNVTDNRLRGFHMGVSGYVYEPLRYRLLLSYRKSWGSYGYPRWDTAHDTSVMLEGIYSFKQVKGLDLKGQLAIDRGNLLGNNFGVLLSLSYNGALNIFGR